MKWGIFAAGFCAGAFLCQAGNDAILKLMRKAVQTLTEENDRLIDLHIKAMEERF